MHFQKVPLVLFLALLIHSNQASLLAQQKQFDEPITVKTTLVSVPVIVSDRGGRYISGLKANDFKLYQDRVEQPISVFDAAEEPLNVALIIDTSKSTRDVLDDIRSAGSKFLKELRPQDHAMLQPMFRVKLVSKSGHFVPQLLGTASTFATAPPVVAMRG